VPGADSDAIVGALLGALAGDCIGAPWEGRRAVTRARGRFRVRRALERPLLPYTDDTQLSLALIDHLVCDPDPVEPALLARRMLARYDDRRGYGAGMRRLVGLWRDGWQVDAAATAVFPDGSFGNGAAMRVAPVGLRWAGKPELITALATRSARVTHVHPVGIDGAVVQAHAVAAAASTRGFGPAHIAALPTMTDQLSDGLRMAAALPSDTPAPAAARALGTAPIAQRSVPAALWCAATAPDVETTIALAVALGGDTDTIGAMAGAVRGAADGPASVPDRWRRTLEGHDEVVAAAERLAGPVAADMEDC
jgi:poly(ADP-ribose) glycohydrolase ARH3